MRGTFQQFGTRGFGGLKLYQSPDLNALDFGSGVAGINAAIQFAAERGDGLGGRVVIPNMGVLWNIDEPIVLVDWVEVVGYGYPHLRLANGVNAPIITSEDFVGGTTHEGIRLGGLHLDCNAANQSSGHGVTLNCRDFLYSDLYIKDAKQRGLYTDYSGSTGPHAGRVEHLTIDGAGEHGWFNDVSDLHANDINVRAAGKGAVSTYDGIHCALTAGGMRLSNVNVWSSEVTNFTRYPINLAGDGNTLTNAHVEAGGLANLMIDGNFCEVSNLLSYNAQGDQNIILSASLCNLEASMQASGFAGKGLKGVEIAGSALGNTVKVRSYGLSGGSINNTLSGGGNHFIVRGDQATMVTGTRHSGDTYDVWSEATLSGFTKRPTKFTAIAGAGTTTANATVLAMNFSTVSFGASTEGVRLSSDWGITGHEGEIVNSSAVAGNVYPHTQGAFQGLGADVPVVIPAYATMTLFKAAAGGWGYILT